MAIIREGATAVITLPKFPDRQIRDYVLKRYDLQPVIDRAIAQSWSGNKKAKRKAQYPPHPYKPTILVSENAIGFDSRGELMFLYLKTIKGKPAISQRVRDRALMGFLKMDFRSCNRSSRPELRGAVAFNGPDGDVEAGEINTGWVHLGRAFEIGASIKNPKTHRRYIENLKQKQHLLPLLRAIDGIFATALPEAFARQNTKIEWKHRHGVSPFSTLTFLRSASSAVHLDARNGTGSLACMTTVDTRTPYSGGAFCFVEYGVEIRVKPGELLIAATPYHWHCNLTPVKGRKYSMICYFKDALQRKRNLKCADCGNDFSGVPKRKPRCPTCLGNRPKRKTERSS